MTKEDLDAFYNEYVALLLPYSPKADEAPPDARPVYIRLFTLPADE
jgi:hypothetical protein